MIFRAVPLVDGAEELEAVCICVCMRESRGVPWLLICVLEHLQDGSSQVIRFSFLLIGWEAGGGWGKTERAKGDGEEEVWGRELKDMSAATSIRLYSQGLTLLLRL